MIEVNHKYTKVNGIQMHYAEAGSGPLVVLCHGFPECWYSWRFQIQALSEAGFHVVAPDQRGYGQTDAPEPVEAYSLCHLAGDIAGLVRELGGGPAVVVGHDWGSPVAFTSALLRPDLFRAVALLSVPYLPRMWGGPKPTDGMRRMCGDDKMFYQLYFQQPGVVERELEEDIRGFLARIFDAGSGKAVKAGRPARFLFDRSQRWVDSLPPPGPLPHWLSESDLEYFVEQFRRGFRGPVNWYRNLDRNSELLAFLAGRKIEQPSLFIGGDQDGVIQIYRDAYDTLESCMPALQAKVLIPGAGHWVQQEQPYEVNQVLRSFLTS